jgi:glycine/D-amino acid oxidase-like deaminating enzyme
MLLAEAKRTRRIGFSVTPLDLDALSRRWGLVRPGALLSAGSAEISAFQLTQGLLEHDMRKRRFRLFQHTKISSLKESEGMVTLRTVRGAKIRARFAIIATGYEGVRFVPTPLVRLHSTYVIASPRFPANALASLGCLMWEAARPYFYLRTTQDHRIVFGGADEPFAQAARRDRLLAKKTTDLEAQFAELFPALAFKAEFAWAGTFAETTDGLPCIGPVSSDSKILCALGYGGNGITFSQIAARLLRDHCLGRKNADAALFVPDRAVAKKTYKQSSK